ncbi:MAG TPA: hypothetical protein VKZ41_03420 [Gemmatimonadales bacterium]|nr:hypothetical protein [Gemmatimonadales bacterium]
MNFASRSTILTAASAVLFLLGMPAGAQEQEPVTGHLPSESPYRDIPWRGQVTAYTGWMNIPTDPAGVAPQSGPIIGSRLDLRLGGPVDFVARLAVVATERNVLDPARPLDERLLGTTGVPLTFMDVGLALNLTGNRTWNRIQPQVHLGLGFVMDTDKTDVGDYRHGTNFALSLGTGVRWIPGSGRFSARLDIADHLFRVRYPALYYGDPSIPEGIPPILDAETARSSWTNNFAITLGATYQFWR